MKFYHVIGLPLALAIGCATNDEDQVHEKEGSDISAVMSGWEIEAASVTSQHPLSNDLKQETLVEAPSTARKFRLFFKSIRMERGYDYLIVQDEHGREIDRITGNHLNYVTRTIRGTKAKVLVETDYSVRSWGYELTQIRHRGCHHNMPQDLQLQPVNSCVALQNAIRDLAIAEVRRRFTDGHFGGPIYRTSNAPTELKSPAHSETNVQVAGVDEGDIVKTDGNHVYALAGRQLRIFRSWPAAATELLHTIDIEGWPKELYVANGRVTVLSGVRGDDFVIPPNVRVGRMMMPIWWNPEAFTKVTVLDFTSGAPTVESETLLAGYYNTSRRVGDALRLVLQRQLKWPHIEYYPNGNIAWDSPEFEEAMDQLEAEAVQIVTNRALADWLPQSYAIRNGQRVPLPIVCEDFLVPSGSDEIGFTAVATVNLSQRPQVQETSALVNAAQVYQSLGNLYLTSNHRWSCYEDAGVHGQYTYLHKFDVSNPARADYRASGGVFGTVNDQFSLDEYRDHLRIATTNNKWQAETPAEQSVSWVHVLDSSMNRVGQTVDLAPGERIFGVRFQGERGFVVTFRQVDPLFTIDLSNPRDPQVLGELKIPGFSTYLHPLDADHIFTVGQDFEEDGRTRNGVALSIFDISDLTNPRLKHKSVVGSTRGYSEALYNHKAFTIYQQPGHSTDFVLAIPFTDFAEDNAPDYWSSYLSTLKVFRISALGILGLGDLDHTDLYVQNQEKRWGWWYRPNIRRGAFVENYVYAISDAGLKVAPIDDLTDVLVSISAPPQFEDPTPTVTRIDDNARSEPNLAIPDNQPGGIQSTLELTKDLEIESLTVDVNIQHTYRGDLKVTIEHNGVVETIHDKTGGSADDVVRNYITERFRGQNAKGTWTLVVSDHASWDTGTLVSWSLNANGKAIDGTTPDPEPVLVEREYTNNEKVDIPDNDRTGIISVIEVPEAFSLTALELSVEITHPYRGDLEVTLEHGGVTHTVHNESGGSADDLNLTVDVDAFDGRDARGTWTLRVKDHARADIGTLNHWRLSLTGEQ